MLQITLVLTFASLVFCNASRFVGDFDQIVLNQSHPITKFWIIHNQWAGANQNLPNLRLSNGAWETIETPSIWIINGFLPVRNDGDHPENCFNRAPAYRNIAIDSKLKTRLREAWPNYISMESEDNFWEDAWLMHGLCMRNLAEVSTPDKYFSKALGMLQEYNIGAILETNGIAPGESYKISTIISAIKEELDIDIQLRCIVDENSAKKEQYLSGAYVCLDKTLQLQNCITDFPTTCNKNKNVFIPFVESRLHPNITTKRTTNQPATCCQIIG